MQKLDSPENRKLGPAVSLIATVAALGSLAYLEHSAKEQRQVPVTAERVLHNEAVSLGSIILKKAREDNIPGEFSPSEDIRDGVNVAITRSNGAQVYFLIAGMKKVRGKLDPRTTFLVVAEEEHPNSHATKGDAVIISPEVRGDFWYGQIEKFSKTDQDNPIGHQDTRGSAFEPQMKLIQKIIYKMESLSDKILRLPKPEQDKSQQA